MVLPISKPCVVVPYDLLGAKNAQALTIAGERLVVIQADWPAMKSRTISTRSAKSRASITRRATDRAEIAIKKILVPTDFSPASKKAFKYALRFARAFGSELTLLHVVEPAISPTFEEIPEAPAFFKAEMADAEKSLRTLVKSVRHPRVPGVRSITRTGLAAHEIVEAGKELHADLIVIATRGYSSWKHLVIGSTAARVARAAACPVLVVREEEHDFV